jgi:hypothetical protein
MVHPVCALRHAPGSRHHSPDCARPAPTPGNATCGTTTLSMLTRPALSQGGPAHALPTRVRPVRRSSSSSAEDTRFTGRVRTESGSYTLSQMFDSVSLTMVGDAGIDMRTLRLNDNRGLLNRVNNGPHCEMAQVNQHQLVPDRTRRMSAFCGRSPCWHRQRSEFLLSRRPLRRLYHGDLYAAVSRSRTGTGRAFLAGERANQTSNDTASFPYAANQPVATSKRPWTLRFDPDHPTRAASLLPGQLEVPRADSHGERRRARLADHAFTTRTVRRQSGLRHSCSNGARKGRDAACQQDELLLLRQSALYEPFFSEILT